jgi:hypothetical protein
VEVARWCILHDGSLRGRILDSLLGLWIPYGIEHDFKMMWFNHNAARSQLAHRLLGGILYVRLCL